MDANKLPYFEEWMSFAIKVRSPKSVSSYVTYINNAIKALSENNVSDDVIVELFKSGQIINKLPTSLVGKKRSNSISAIKYYLSFRFSILVPDDNENNNNDDFQSVEEAHSNDRIITDANKSNQGLCLFKMSSIPNEDENYDFIEKIEKDKLSAEFKKRLRTDNRFTVDSTYIPMKLICKLFKESESYKEYNDWLTQVSDNIIFITEDGCIRLKNIEHLGINKAGDMFIKLSCKKEPVQLYGFSDKGVIKPWKVPLGKDLSSISRDHFPEIGEVSRNANLPTLEKITHVCNEIGITSNSRYNENINKINLKDKFKDVKLKDLLDDLRKIEDSTTFTAMDRSLNSSKGGPRSFKNTFARKKK